MTVCARSQARCLPSTPTSWARMPAASSTVTPSPPASALQFRNASCSNTVSLMSPRGVVPGATTSNSIGRAVKKVALLPRMWMATCVVKPFEFDRSVGEHHEREGRLLRCGSLGASDEQPDLGVEAFVTRSLDSPRLMAASIPARCVRIVRASRFPRNIPGLSVSNTGG